MLLFDANDEAIAPPPALNGGATYDYHITGAPDATTGAYPAGGAVVFNNAPAVPVATIQIARILPITQPVAFIDDAAIPASTLNLELDRLTMIAQQLDAGLFTESGDLPPQASPESAGMVPVVKSDGSGYEMRTALLLATDLTAFDGTGHRIENLLAPVAVGDAVNLDFLNTAVATLFSYIDTGDNAATNHADAGDATTLTAANNHSDAGDAASKIYTDAGDAATLTAAKGYTDSAIAGTGQVPTPAAGDADSVLTAIGADDYIWAPIDATKIVKGTLSAQRLNLGTRLAANGTLLNGLAPLTRYNQTAASPTNTAIDDAINEYTGTGGNHIWNLPAVAPGMCLAILLPNTTATCTIKAAGSDAMVAPTGSYTNAAPLVIPACAKGTQQTIVLSGQVVPPAQGIWTVTSVPPEIAEAMGWVSTPVLSTTFLGANAGVSAGTWVRPGLTDVYYDSHNWWFNGLAYKPQRPGQYFVSWNAFLGDNTVGSVTSFYVGIFLNGGAKDIKGVASNGGNFLPSINACSANAIITMNGTTDYIEPYVQVSAGAPTFFGNSAPCRLSIFYLGP